MDEVRIIQVVTQMGSFGLLAYMAIFGLPRLLVAAREEMALQRREAAKERIRLSTRSEFLENALTKQLQVLRVLLCAIAARLHVVIDEDMFIDPNGATKHPTKPGDPP